MNHETTSQALVVSLQCTIRCINWRLAMYPNPDYDEELEAAAREILETL